MKLLLTGATGFVGRNFLLQAIQRGEYEEIILPIRSVEKLQAQFIGDGFDYIPKVIRPVVGTAGQWNLDHVEVNHVVHCAGTVFERARDGYFKVNVEGTLKLLGSLAKADKIILLSSQAAAGPCTSPDQFKNEKDQDEPVTWYGESKLEMERRVKEQFPQLNYAFLRPPWVMGPRDIASLQLFKMVRTRVHLKPGLKPKYYSFISVDDLVAAIFSALKHSDWTDIRHEKFYVCSDTIFSDKELIASTAAVSDRRGVLVKIPHPVVKVITQVVDAVPALRSRLPTLTVDRSHEILPERWVISPERFSKSFAWRAKDSLQTTLKSMHDWYLKTGKLL